MSLMEGRKKTEWSFYCLDGFCNTGTVVILELSPATENSGRREKCWNTRKSKTCYKFPKDKNIQILKETT